MKKNRKREVIVSTILLIASIIGGIVTVIVGRSGNLESLSTELSHIVGIVGGGIGSVVLFIWSVNSLMTTDDKKLTKEEIARAIVPLKEKREKDPLRYAPGEQLMAWRRAKKQSESP